MNLQDLGFNEQMQRYIVQEKLEAFEIGRVIAEHKERYVLKTPKNEFDAEITGNMRYSAIDRQDFPVVGDWVAFNAYDNNFALIHKILPRFSVLQRKAVGHFGETQIIAANIDYALLIQAVDRDFNINRLERYLTLCYASKVAPVIVLTKIDLIDQLKLNEIVSKLNLRIKNVKVTAISNLTNEGFQTLMAMLENGKTYCLLGSSGVGKSTLLNNMIGKPHMKTDTISKSVNKGRHVTSHRELVVIENGGIIIDNPGMREVGITDATGGVESVFDAIAELAQYCKYKNCTHSGENKCAVIDALNKGDIDKNAYENYLKLEKERAFFETSAIEKKKKEKIFGKILKDYNKKDVKGKNC